MSRNSTQYLPDDSLLHKIYQENPGSVLAQDLLFFCKMKIWQRVGAAELVVFFLSVAALPGTAGIIPAHRLCDWSHAGVPGGIPYRTNIFVNLLTTTNPLYKCYADGVHDDSGSIKNAMLACPSNQVIYAPSGRYMLSNQIASLGTSRHFTLRGNGMGQTVFLLNHSGNAITMGGGQYSLPTNQAANITSSALVGTTNITIDNPSLPYLTPNWYLVLDQLDDHTNVTHIGEEGPAGYGRVTTTNRSKFQIVLIKSVTNGTNITFWPPLHWDMVPQFVPQAVTMFQPPISWVGFEDCTFSNITSASEDLIDLSYAYACWARNVEFANVVGHDLLWDHTLQCEIRDCYLHGAYGFTVGNGYGLTFMGSFSTLFENNIVYGMYGPIIVEAGSGNVLGYNYVAHTVSSPTNYMICGISMNHMVYSCFNLSEGNVVNEIQADWVHGNSGFLTIFRNFCTGTDYGISANQKPISIDAWSLSNNIVGNVLGSPGITWSYMNTNVNFSSPTIYRIGFPWIGGNSFVNITNAIYMDTNADYDTRVLASAFIEGNYDFAHGATIWTNTGTALPNGMAPTTLDPSLYLTSKPSWWTNWGETAWPPIGPDVPGMTNAIPAQLRLNLIMTGDYSGGGSLGTFRPSAPLGLRVISSNP